MLGARVLIVDDAGATIDNLVPAFESVWPKVAIIHETVGAYAVKLARLRELDLVIVNADSPDVNGLQVCTAIRRFSAVPIMALGASDSSAIAVRALESGADLYVSKLLHPKVLTARAQALVRRYRGTWLWTGQHRSQSSVSAYLG